MVNRKGIDINKANERLGQFLKEHKHPIFESVNPIDENGNRVSQEEAIDITDTFQPLSHFILFPRHPAHADITVMGLIARHLCDLVLIPHNSVVSRDHILYWNFTRNLILRGKRQKEDFRLFSGERENLLGDFNTMVEVASIPWRLNSVEDTLVEEIQDSGLLQYNLGQINVLSQLGPSSLALLDGFVSDPSVFDSDGQMKNESVERPWRPDSSSGGSWNYHDKILYWKEYDSNESTKESLEQINDLDRYNTDWLEHKAGVEENKINIEDGDTDNYLHILTGQRNYTMHGHGSGFSITPVVINLICLYLWDNLGSEMYEELVHSINEELGDWSDQKIDK